MAESKPMLDLADELNEIASRISVLHLGILGIGGSFALTRETDGLARMAADISGELRTIAAEIWPEPTETA